MTNPSAQTKKSFKKLILVVDDEAAICDYVEALVGDHFDVSKAYDADAAKQSVKERVPDLILLDLRLQNHDGLELCRFFRESPETRKVPVLIFSGQDDLEVLTEAFDRGADDYIVKTAQPREIVARIFSKIRRLDEAHFQSDRVICGNLELDSVKLEATIDSKAIQLSVLEFNLLKFFALNKNRVVSRAQILAEVWRDSLVSNRTIDTHVVYLRKKIIGCNHLLATIYGAGYLFRERTSDDASSEATTSAKK